MPRIQEKNSESSQFFTNEQLVQFGKELNQAGSFDELMIQKQAAKRKNGVFIVMRYNNPKDYQAHHLTGVYQDAPFHTDIPYRFWEQVLKEWRHREGKYSS